MSFLPKIIVEIHETAPRSSRALGKKGGRRPPNSLSRPLILDIDQRRQSRALQIELPPVYSAGRSNLGTRTILGARGRFPHVRSSSPSIVRRRSRGSLPRLHLRQGFRYTTFYLPLPDYRISSARLFRRRCVREHPHLRARCLRYVQKHTPRKSGYRRSLGQRANHVAQQAARPINLSRHNRRRQGVACVRVFVPAGPERMA